MVDWTETHVKERPTGAAMRKGAMGRCPSCGEGKLFEGYLRVRNDCPKCGEEFFHQRADDGPAYFTILLVTHLGAPILMWVFMVFRPSPISMLISFSVGAVLLSLLFLQPIKGAMIGAQWARRMHGFGKAKNLTP